MDKVIFFHNMVAPYRHSLFHELGKRINLEVWFSTLLTKDRKWSTDIPPLYEHIVLKNITMYAFGRPFIYCPDLIKKINAAHPRIIISVFTRSNALDILRLSFIAKKRNIPLILFVGDIESPGFRDDVPRIIESIFNWYKKKTLGLAKGFIYYCALSKLWAEKNGANGPCILGTQVLDGDHEPRIDKGFTGDKIKCLYVGKLEERKGVDLLPGVISKLGKEYTSKLKINIVGDGPLSTIVSQLEEIGIDVEYSAHVPRNQLWSVYREADFLVVPSRHDPWGFVVNESMAVGTPVLISKQAGAAELAEGPGWIFDVCNQDTFVTEFRNAINACREHGRREAAVVREKEYRADIAAEKICKLINEILSSHV